MKVIAGGRQSGRTTKLIHLCAEAEKNGEVAYIVCHSSHEAYRIARRARVLGYEGFPFPVSYDEFLRSQGFTFTTKYFIDNVEMLLQRLTPLTIGAISVTIEDEQ